MAVFVQQCYDLAMDLTPEDRAELAALLLESIEPEDGPMDPSWMAEVGRRLAAVRDGTADLIPIEEAMRELDEP